MLDSMTMRSHLPFFIQFPTADLRPLNEIGRKYRLYGYCMDIVPPLLAGLPQLLAVLPHIIADLLHFVAVCCSRRIARRFQILPVSISR